ncbi:hypothetical protein [Actinomadura vinacea]
MASDAMRTALEKHFDVRLAFQNCHRAAAFRPDAQHAYQEFVTACAEGCRAVEHQRVATLAVPPRPLIAAARTS